MLIRSSLSASQCGSSTWQTKIWELLGYAKNFSLECKTPLCNTRHVWEKTRKQLSTEPRDVHKNEQGEVETAVALTWRSLPIKLRVIMISELILLLNTILFVIVIDIIVVIDFAYNPLIKKTTIRETNESKGKQVPVACLAIAPPMSIRKLETKAIQWMNVWNTRRWLEAHSVTVRSFPNGWCQWIGVVLVR